MGAEKVSINIEKAIDDTAVGLSTLRKEMPQPLSEEIKESMQTISHNDFLSQYSDVERLQLLTKPNSKTANIWEKLTFNFNFTGIGDNRGLYLKTTAGQVLPDTVGTVMMNKVSYSRSAIDGEFFDSKWNRLIIKTGTTIEVSQTRTPQDLEKMEQKVDEMLESQWYSEKSQEYPMLMEAVSRGFDMSIITSIFNKYTLKANETWEEVMTQIDRIKWKTQKTLQDHSVQTLIQEGLYGTSSKKDEKNIRKNTVWIKKASTQDIIYDVSDYWDVHLESKEEFDTKYGTFISQIENQIGTPAWIWSAIAYVESSYWKHLNSKTWSKWILQLTVWPFRDMRWDKTENGKYSKYADMNKVEDYRNVFKKIDFESLKQIDMWDGSKIWNTLSKDIWNDLTRLQNSDVSSADATKIFNRFQDKIKWDDSTYYHTLNIIIWLVYQNYLQTYRYGWDLRKSIVNYNGDNNVEPDGRKHKEHYADKVLNKFNN